VFKKHPRSAGIPSQRPKAFCVKLTKNASGTVKNAFRQIRALRQPCAGNIALPPFSFVRCLKAAPEWLRFSHHPFPDGPHVQQVQQSVTASDMCQLSQSASVAHEITTFAQSSRER
jgi:hypothetical protein